MYWFSTQQPAQHSGNLNIHPHILLDFKKRNHNLLQMMDLFFLLQSLHFLSCLSVFNCAALIGLVLNRREGTFSSLLISQGELSIFHQWSWFLLLFFCRQSWSDWGILYSCFRSCFYNEQPRTSMKCLLCIFKVAALLLLSLVGVQKGAGARPPAPRTPYRVFLVARPVLGLGFQI